MRRLMWGETELQNLRNRFKRKAKIKATKPAKDAPRQRDQSMDSLLRAKQRATREAQESESRRQEAGGSPPPMAPPPPSGMAAPPLPPIERAPVSSQTPPSSQPQPAPEEDEEDSPLARLRAAKRRARGEE